MKTKPLQILAAVFLVTLTLGVPLRAAIVTPIYAVAGLSDAYQFGVFDLDSPTGSPGSYQYAWTSLGSSSATPLANLALNPVTSQMYLQYNFNQYRTVSTAGVIGDSLGSMSTLWGMAFDNAGNLYGAHNDQWFALDPATGATITTTTMSVGIYSQFGGGLTYASDGDFYFGTSFFDYLSNITAGGVDTQVGTFSGTNYNGADWMAMFSSGVNTYLLNEDRLYQVNLTDASLSLLGTITGLPVDFASGFSGAVGIASAAPAPVPEPGTWAAAALLAGGAAFMRWRKRRVS